MPNPNKSLNYQSKKNSANIWKNIMLIIISIVYSYSVSFVLFRIYGALNTSLSCGSEACGTSAILLQFFVVPLVTLLIIYPIYLLIKKGSITIKIVVNVLAILCIFLYIYQKLANANPDLRFIPILSPLFWKFFAY